MKYRKLTDSEIEILEAHDSHAEDWNSVLVKEKFDPERIRDVRFSGQVKLGNLHGTLMIDDGLHKQSGLYHACIQDCTIGDNVYIADVKNLVRYHIESGVLIENVASLIVSGETSFGNGTEIEVINEGGGRETIIFDRLTSQIGYLQAVYRHDPIFIEKLKGLIQNYVKTKKASHGTIGKGARIFNSGNIRNVAIGENTVISGVLHLKEGTIAGSKQDPAFLGEGVVAKHFIILSGSRVDGASMIDRCFIGQGVLIGKQFSAKNSCFFANCEAYHGEACNIFAGPYTVTHHKSTLLIAGLFSFFNAGSGTNQSNHMYKLGPVHQGILERGVKTGSFSYLMWPCRVGAFSIVVGKHYSHFDTSDLPFSYILESDGFTTVRPSLNIATIGTRRELKKYSMRDRRKDPCKHDLIQYELLNPYTVGKMIRGVELLKSLNENAPVGSPILVFRGVRISKSKLKIGVRNYEMAIAVYIGNQVVKVLEGLSDSMPIENVLDNIDGNNLDGVGRWVDLSGLLSPMSAIENFVDDIVNGQITSMDGLTDKLRATHDHYTQLCLGWCIDLIKKRFGLDSGRITKKHIIRIIHDWRMNSLRLNNIIMKDAAKEFSETSRIGYGIDGDEDVRNRDFEAVRGRFKENEFVVKLKEESERIAKHAEDLITVLKSL